MSELINKLHARFKLSKVSISFTLYYYTNDYNWNVYRNVCHHHTLQIELNEIINVHKLPAEAILLTTNLVTKIMETNKTHCVKCNSKLTRNFKYVKNKKGAIGLLYDNKQGPIITVHYVHKCSNENCNSIYYHNHYFVDGALTLESVITSQQMNSKMTFFDDNVVDEAINLGAAALSPSRYTENWNERFSDEIDNIKAYLISTDQVIGNRGTDASLCVNRLRDAIMFRGLHRTLELELKQDNITIEKELIDKYRQNKMHRLLSSELKGDRELNDKWLSCIDYFRIIFDKYESILSTAGMDWIKYVPVNKKDNKILLKHFILVGDVAVGINVADCAYPKQLYQNDNQHLKNQMSKEVFERMSCHESPQRGNGSSYTFATCSGHTIKLHQLGIPTKKINKFCLYDRVQKQIQSYLKNHTEEKDNQTFKEKKLQDKLNAFEKDDIKMFKDVMNKALSIEPRSRRSNYQQTLANINESLQYENDEVVLSSIENYAEANNMDPAILNNPELFKIIESEIDDPKTWDKLNGCRKGRHVFKKEDNVDLAILERSGGIQSWWNQAGYCLSLEEVKYRETPTQVIISMCKILLLCKLTIEWTERMCGVSYDMFCVMFPRMITLIKMLWLPIEYISLLIYLMPYGHIDRFHVWGHVAALCQAIGGLFNPYCNKFKGILYGHGQKNNDQVAEQNWVSTNKLTFVKNMSKREFKMFLVLYKVRINKTNTRRLLKKGYYFVHISKIKKIRNLSQIKTVQDLPTTDQLLNSECYQKLLKPEFL
eukprot:36426_1